MTADALQKSLPLPIKRAVHLPTKRERGTSQKTTRRITHPGHDNGDELAGSPGGCPLAGHRDGQQIQADHSAHGTAHNPLAKKKKKKEEKRKKSVRAKGKEKKEEEEGMLNRSIAHHFLRQRTTANHRRRPRHCRRPWRPRQWMPTAAKAETRASEGAARSRTGQCLPAWPCPRACAPANDPWLFKNQVLMQGPRKKTKNACPVSRVFQALVSLCCASRGRRNSRVPAAQHAAHATGGAMAADLVLRSVLAWLENHDLLFFFRRRNSHTAA